MQASPRPRQPNPEVVSWSTLPIAMLHHVSNRRDWKEFQPFVIQEDTFRRFLDVVESSRRKTRTFRQFIDTEPANTDVILTFDDCGQHLLDFAVPELVNRGMNAVFYVPTSQIGGHNDWNVAQGKPRMDLMNEADLKELHRLGMEVGGHGHDHIRMAEQSASDVLEQLDRSQDILTEILGQPAVSMAYPYGSLPGHAKSVLSQVGMRWGCSIFSQKQAHHCLRRFIVHDGDTRRSLKVKLHPVYSLYRRITDPRKG